MYLLARASNRDTESYPSATKVADAVSVPIVASPEAYWEKR